MLFAINHRENWQDINNKEDHFLSYDEPDLCKDYTSKEQDKVDRVSINFSKNCVLGNGLLDTNPLVDSWKEVERSSKKPRSVDPRK